MDPRLAFAIETARAAGQSTLSLFGTRLAVDRKADNSPVTQADLNAEEIIRQRIEAQFPGEPVLGEEQGLTGHGDDRWVVDPIDGTKSFVAGVPLYATLLSFERAGEPEIAVCYLPALDDVYWAKRGEGAWRNGKPCRVADLANLSEATVCSGSYRSMRDHGRLPGWENLAGEAAVSRGWSDAYGHMLVARGNSHAMIDPVVSRWDISAPSLIVREAGGVWMNFDGSEDLRTEGISCSPGLRTAILEAFGA